MYRFVTAEGTCGNPYSLEKCEQNANKMLGEGFELVQVYQTTTPGCGGSKSILVMVFKKAT